MSILVIMHAPAEGPCALGRVLRDQGYRLDTVHLYRGGKLPADLREVEGIVSMGGPMNVEDAPQLPWMEEEMALMRRALAGGVPLVGVCLGAQLIGAAMGGEVKAMPGGAEIGWHPIKLGFPGSTDPLLAGFPAESSAFHMHGQEVSKLPPEAVPLAGSKLCRNQAFRVGLKTYGFQFHFEWDLQELAEVLKDPFVAKTGHDAAAIMREASQHYGEYRRLGDRLCAQIGMMLMQRK